jgi:hypothetical protein
MLICTVRKACRKAWSLASGPGSAASVGRCVAVGVHVFVAGLASDVGRGVGSGPGHADWAGAVVRVVGFAGCGSWPARMIVQPTIAITNATTAAIDRTTAA